MADIPMSDVVCEHKLYPVPKVGGSVEKARQFEARKDPPRWEDVSASHVFRQRFEWHPYTCAAENS